MGADSNENTCGRAGVMKFKAVIFDLGGVVVNMDFGPKLQPWLKRLNLPAEEIHHRLWSHPFAAKAMKGEMRAGDYWKLTGSEIGLEESEVPLFRNDYYDNSSPDKQMLELVHHLKNQGIKVGLLSNTMDDADHAFKELGFLGFFDHFDNVILSHQEGMAKPETGIYLLACSRLGVDPTDAAHIDDLYENVVGARTAGLKGWLFHRDEIDRLKEFLFGNAKN